MRGNKNETDLSSRVENPPVCIQLQPGHKVVNHNSNYFDGPDAHTYALRMCFIFIFGFFYQFCPSLSPALRRGLTSDFIIGTYSDLFAGVQVIIIPQLRPHYVYVYKWEVYDFAHDYRRKWCSSNLFIQYNNACISGAIALLPEYSPSVSAPREESYYYIFPHVSQSFCRLSRENYRVLRSPITLYSRVPAAAMFSSSLNKHIIYNININKTISFFQPFYLFVSLGTRLNHYAVAEETNRIN